MAEYWWNLHFGKFGFSVSVQKVDERTPHSQFTVMEDTVLGEDKSYIQKYGVISVAASRPHQYGLTDNFLHSVS